MFVYLYPHFIAFLNVLPFLIWFVYVYVAKHYLIVFEYCSCSSGLFGLVVVRVITCFLCLDESKDFIIHYFIQYLLDLLTRRYNTHVKLHNLFLLQLFITVSLRNSIVLGQHFEKIYFKCIIYCCDVGVQSCCLVCVNYLTEKYYFYLIFELYIEHCTSEYLLRNCDYIAGNPYIGYTISSDE